MKAVAVGPQTLEMAIEPIQSTKLVLRISIRLPAVMVINLVAIRVMTMHGPTHINISQGTFFSHKILIFPFVK